MARGRSGEDVGEGCAPEKLFFRHWAFALALGHGDVHRASAAGNFEVSEVGAGSGVAVCDLGVQEFDAFTVDVAPRTWEWGEASDLSADFRSGFGPVDAGFALVDLLGIGNARFGLGRRCECWQFGEGSGDQFCAERAEFVVEAAGGVVVGNGQSFGQKNRAGIEPGFHLHDGDAGFCVASHDGTVDRGGAAPTGQQRGVDVEAAMSWRIEDWLRQDQAVSDDNGDVGFVGLEGGKRLVGFQEFWRKDRQAKCFGAHVDGGWAIFLAAPGGARGLRVDGGDVVASFDQRVQSQDREIGGAHEDQSHWVFLTFFRNI